MNPSKAKRVTISDIAKALNISCTHVSATLGHKPYCCASAKTQSLIRTKARELGYRPNLIASALRNGHTHLIGITTHNMTSPNSTGMLIAMTEILQSNGFRGIIDYDKGENVKMMKAVQSAFDRGCDAVISFAPYIHDELPGELTSVFFCHYLLPGSEPEKNHVYINAAAGLYAAWEHLLALGHKQIHLLTCHADVSNDIRYMIFREFCKKNGFDVNKCCVNFADMDEFDTGFVRKFLLEHPECTAVQCSDDNVAIKFMQICNHLGLKLPEDMSTVGYNNTSVTQYVSPALSSIQLDHQQVCRLLMQNIQTTLQKKEVSGLQKADSTFILRESVSVPRRGSLTIKSQP